MNNGIGKKGNVMGGEENGRVYITYKFLLVFFVSSLGIGLTAGGVLLKLYSNYFEAKIEGITTTVSDTKETVDKMSDNFDKRLRDLEIAISKKSEK